MLTELTENLQRTLPDAPLHPRITEIGEVIYVGDGVIRLQGLPTAHIDDVVDIETESGIVKALILGLSGESIEAVVLGDYTSIRQGDIARSTQGVLQIQSGESLLGRVIDVMGNPLDGKGPIKSSIWMPVERQAPGVAKREPVTQQLDTGILVVDTIIPLGKGQRELIIGDRKSGKTTLMEAFIMNQKGMDITCIYVAIGAQKAKIRGLHQRLEKAGAMDYTCIVVGSADEPPSNNWIAPYAGAAIGEWFMDHGKEAFVVFDDLSKHAKAYRQMSLLLKRSPGRDAYPGDIFYLHSRLLERTCRVNKGAGGGSLTGFPVAETQNGDQSEYIVTNLMSITDGHIYLDINLMHEGIYPAVNSGASVSRIGGSIQPPYLRKQGELAGSIMARYNEVKSYETLNTEISEDTEREIKRGKRMLEIFAQELALSLRHDEKSILLYLVTSGRSDNIELPDLRAIRVAMVDFYRAGKYDDLREKLFKDKDLDAISSMIDLFFADYAASSPITAAQQLIKPKEAVEAPLPIVPDPKSAPDAHP